MNKIKVGGINYNIRKVPFVEVLGDRNNQGCVHFLTNEILVLDTLSQDRTNQVIIHELVHSIFYEAGIEDEENIVNRIGHILHQVLQDNDFSFLKKEKNKWKKRK